MSMGLLTLASFGAVPGPFYNYVHYGTYATLYNLKLPYFNRYPNIEFLINIGWETFIASLAFGGMLLIEAKMAFCNNTISVSSKLTEMELNQMSDALEHRNGVSQGMSGPKLRIILMRVLYMDE